MRLTQTNQCPIRNDLLGILQNLGMCFAHSLMSNDKVSDGAEPFASPPGSSTPNRKDK